MNIEEIVNVATHIPVNLIGINNVVQPHEKFSFSEYGIHRLCFMDTWYG